MGKTQSKPNDGKNLKKLTTRRDGGIEAGLACWYEKRIDSFWYERTKTRWNKHK